MARDEKVSAEAVIRDIRRQTRKKYSAEEKIRIVLEGLRGEDSIAEHFIRTFKEEHIGYSEYEDFDDAQSQLQYWLEVAYMTERLHQALESHIGGVRVGGRFSSLPSYFISDLNSSRKTTALQSVSISQSV